MPDLATDCLLAVVGLVPDEVTARERRAAAVLPETFTSRAHAWWKATEREKIRDLKTPDLEKLFDSIATPPTQTDVKEWLGEDPEDEGEQALNLFLSLSAAREYLVNGVRADHRPRWPRIIIDTYAGPRLMPLAIDDEAEITSLWAVLNEPTRVLDEMDCAGLTPSQAEAFRAAYPALFAHYWTELLAEAARLTAKDPEWMPDEEQTVILGVLSGQPPGVQKYDAAPPPPDGPKPQKDLGASAAETQLDKSAKPKSAK
jgi:hypothetical protein